MKNLEIGLQIKVHNGWTLTVTSIKYERHLVDLEWNTIIYFNSKRGIENGPDTILPASKVIEYLTNGEFEYV